MIYRAPTNATASLYARLNARSRQQYGFVHVEAIHLPFARPKAAVAAAVGGSRAASSLSDPLLASPLLRPVRFARSFARLARNF